MRSGERWDHLQVCITFGATGNVVLPWDCSSLSTPSWYWTFSTQREHGYFELEAPNSWLQTLRTNFHYPWTFRVYRRPPDSEPYGLNENIFSFGSDANLQNPWVFRETEVFCATDLLDPASIWSKHWSNHDGVRQTPSMDSKCSLLGWCLCNGPVWSAIHME